VFDFFSFQIVLLFNDWDLLNAKEFFESFDQLLVLANNRSYPSRTFTVRENYPNGFLVELKGVYGFEFCDDGGKGVLEIILKHIS
jgi:hypothetical protein